METSITAQILLPKRKSKSAPRAWARLEGLQPTPPCTAPQPCRARSRAPGHSGCCASHADSPRARPGHTVTAEDDARSSKAVVTDAVNTQATLQGSRATEVRGPAGRGRGAQRPRLAPAVSGLLVFVPHRTPKSRPEALQGSCQSFHNRLLNLYVQNLIFLETAREYFFFLQ